MKKTKQATNDSTKQKQNEPRRTRSFVLCPICKSKSKKLRSEMGGYETRRCRMGHMFHYDKWIADRAFWAPILGGRIPNPYD